MILVWLNINFKLLKIGSNQTRYVGRETCLEWLPPPEKSSGFLGDIKNKKHLCDQWLGMASCKSPSYCTVNQKTGCISELHLVDPVVKKYSACVPFTKHAQRIQDFLNTGKFSYSYKKDLDCFQACDEVCFQYDMAYNKFKDLQKRTQSDIVLKNKALVIASNPKYNCYERGLASIVYKFFDKKSKGSGLKENQENSLANSQLANELHKPIIRKFKKRKVYSSFKDNIWGVDLADMQLISRHN